MSNAALDWAFSATISRSSDKFVLVCLANYASRDGISFPSEARIVGDTALNRKTVIEALRRLVEAGLIAKTGEKCGATRQIFVYRLAINGPEYGTFEESKDGVETQSVAAPPPIISIPKPGMFDEIDSDERVPFFPYKSPVFSVKESRFFPKESRKRDTEPLEPSTTKRNPLVFARGDATHHPPRPIIPKEPKPKPQTSINPKWTPTDADIAFAQSRSVDPFEQAERFIAYHESKGSLMKSWAAAWRTWILNSGRFNSHSPSGRVDPKEGRRAAYANPNFGKGG